MLLRLRDTMFSWPAGARVVDESCLPLTQAPRFVGEGLSPANLLLQELAHKGPAQLLLAAWVLLSASMMEMPRVNVYGDQYQ